jgi:hypothetical protein
MGTIDSAMQRDILVEAARRVPDDALLTSLTQGVERQLILAIHPMEWILAGLQVAARRDGHLEAEYRIQPLYLPLDRPAFVALGDDRDPFALRFFSRRRVQWPNDADAFFRYLLEEGMPLMRRTSTPKGFAAWARSGLGPSEELTQWPEIAENVAYAEILTGGTSRAIALLEDVSRSDPRTWQTIWDSESQDELHARLVEMSRIATESPNLAVTRLESWRAAAVSRLGLDGAMRPQTSGAPDGD